MSSTPSLFHDGAMVTNLRGTASCSRPVLLRVRATYPAYIEGICDAGTKALSSLVDHELLSEMKYEKCLLAFVSW